MTHVVGDITRIWKFKYVRFKVEQNSGIHNSLCLFIFFVFIYKIIAYFKWIFTKTMHILSSSVVNSQNNSVSVLFAILFASKIDAMS